MKITKDHNSNEVLLLTRANGVVKLFNRMKKELKDDGSKTFFGGSRAIGYNCDNSDVDVFLYFDDPDFESDFIELLEGDGYEKETSTEASKHDACSVYNCNNVDICFVNEEEDFDDMKKKTSLLKNVIKGNKDLIALCVSMNVNDTHAEVFARMSKAFLDSE